MIIVTGSVVVKDELREQALAPTPATVTAGIRTIRSPRSTPNKVRENPARLVFVEEWADQAALAAHFAVPASRAFAKVLGTLAVEPPRLQVFEAQRTTG